MIIKNKVDKLLSKIDDKLHEIRIIQFRIEALQDKCKHKDGYKRDKFHRTHFSCPHCGKVDQ